MGTATEIVRFQPKNNEELFMSYMGHLKNGGLFVPTVKEHTLGDEIFIILTMHDDNTRYTAEGKVVWINPKTSNDKGVGVMFNDDPKFIQLKQHIEQKLGKLLYQQRRTTTF